MFIFGPLWFVVIVWIIYYLAKKKSQNPALQTVYHCSKCAAVVSYGSKFCSSCGIRMSFPQQCSYCGGQISEGARFCAQCGIQQPALVIDPVEALEKSAKLQAAQAVFDKKERKTAIMFCAIAGAAIVLGVFLFIITNS